MGRSQRAAASLGAQAKQLRIAKGNDQLVKVLKNVHVSLKSLTQDCDKTAGLKLLATELVGDRLINHNNIDVRILVAGCLVDIMRLYAPDAPYTEDEVVAVFDLITEQLGRLSNEFEGPTYERLLYITNSLATVRSCVMLAELAIFEENEPEPRSEPMMALFKVLFTCVRAKHSNKIIQHITDIVLACIEFMDFDQVESKVLSSICCHLLPSQQKNTQKYTVVKNVLSNSRIHDHVASYARGLVSGMSTFQGKKFGGKNSGSKQISFIIKELAKIAPVTLMYAIPTLCGQLEVVCIHQRSAVISLLGEIFCSKTFDFTAEYNTDFRSFLNRCQDVDERVRVFMTETCGALLAHRPEQIKLILPRLMFSLKTASSEEVRRTAVRVVCGAAQENVKNIPEELLQEVAVRSLTEKNKGMCCEAATGLAVIYKKQTQDTQDNTENNQSESLSQNSDDGNGKHLTKELRIKRKLNSDVLCPLSTNIDWIPFSVISSFFRKIPAIRERVIQLLDDILLPRRSSSTTRGCGLIRIYMVSIHAAQNHDIVRNNKLVKSVLATGCEESRGQIFVKTLFKSIFRLRNGLRGAFLSYLQTRDDLRMLQSNGPNSNDANENDEEEKSHDKNISRLESMVKKQLLLLAHHALNITEKVTDAQMKKTLFQLHNQKDQRVFELFKTILDIKTPLSIARQHRNELLSRLNASNTRMKLGDRLKPLLRFLMMSTVNIDNVPILLHALKSLPIPKTLVLKNKPSFEDSDSEESEDYSEDESEFDEELAAEQVELLATVSILDLLEITAANEPGLFHTQWYMFSDLLNGTIESFNKFYSCDTSHNQESYMSRLLKIIADVGIHFRYLENVNSTKKQKKKSTSKRSNDKSSSDDDNDDEDGKPYLQKMTDFLDTLRNLSFGKSIATFSNTRNRITKKGKKKSSASSESVPFPYSHLATQAYINCIKGFSSDFKDSSEILFDGDSFDEYMEEYLEVMTSSKYLSLSNVNLPYVLSSLSVLAESISSVFSVKYLDIVKDFVFQKSLAEWEYSEVAAKVAAKKQKKGKKSKKQLEEQSQRELLHICNCKENSITLLISIVKGSRAGKPAISPDNEEFSQTLTLLCECIEQNGNLRHSTLINTDKDSNDNDDKSDEAFEKEMYFIRKAASRGIISILACVRLEDEPRHFLATSRALSDTDSQERAFRASSLITTINNAGKRRCGALSCLLSLVSGDDTPHIKAKGFAELKRVLQSMNRRHSGMVTKLSEMSEEKRDAINRFVIPEIATLPLSCYLIAHLPCFSDPYQNLHTLRCMKDEFSKTNAMSVDESDDDNEDAQTNWTDALDKVTSYVTPLLNILVGLHKSKADKVTSYSMLSRIIDVMGSHDDRHVCAMSLRRSPMKHFQDQDESNLSIVCDIVKRIIAKKTEKIQLDGHLTNIILPWKFYHSKNTSRSGPRSSIGSMGSFLSHGDRESMSGKKRSRSSLGSSRGENSPANRPLLTSNDGELITPIKNTSTPLSTRNTKETLLLRTTPASQKKKRKTDSNSAKMSSRKSKKAKHTNKSKSPKMKKNTNNKENPRPNSSRKSAKKKQKTHTPGTRRSSRLR